MLSKLTIETEVSVCRDASRAQMTFHLLQVRQDMLHPHRAEGNNGRPEEREQSGRLKALLHKAGLKQHDTEGRKAVLHHLPKPAKAF